MFYWMGWMGQIRSLSLSFFFDEAVIVPTDMWFH